MLLWGLGPSEKEAPLEMTLTAQRRSFRNRLVPSPTAQTRLASINRRVISRGYAAPRGVVVMCASSINGSTHPHVQALTLWEQDVIRVVGDVMSRTDAVDEDLFGRS
jgi:hypothetical protein